MSWTNIVTDPIGLVAFSLALVFGMVGIKFKSRDKPWFLPVALVFAAISLVGGLYLAHRKIVSEKGSPTTQTPASIKVQQETHGAGSPAVQGAQGDVTITIDQRGSNRK